MTPEQLIEIRELLKTAAGFTSTGNWAGVSRAEFSAAHQEKMEAAAGLCNKGHGKSHLAGIPGQDIPERTLVQGPEREKSNWIQALSTVLQRYGNRATVRILRREYDCSAEIVITLNDNDRRRHAVTDPATGYTTVYDDLAGSAGQMQREMSEMHRQRAEAKHRAAHLEARAKRAEALSETTRDQYEQANATLRGRIFDLQRRVLDAERARTGPSISPDATMLRRLIQLCHPDKHNGSEASGIAIQWLNNLKDRS